MSYIDSEKTFFGREDTLAILKRRVVDLKEGYRQNVAILSSRYIGKTSLLKHFMDDLDDPDITIIYLDLENKDFQYFVDKFIASLLYNYSKNCNLTLYDNIPKLIDSTAEYIPQTTAVIRKIRENFQNAKFKECYLGILTLPEIFTNETGKYCVLICDEFQAMEDFDLPKFFQDLGQKIMTQKRCFYLLSSSYPVVAQNIISEKLSLLFGNFETIEIEAFDNQTGHEYIAQNLKSCRLGVHLSNFLIDFTGGHPLYLNLLCQEFKNLAAIHNQSEIYIPLLTQAIENTIFDKWGVLSRHFELIIHELSTDKDNKLIPSIFMAIVNDNHKVSDIVNHTQAKRAQITQRLNKLVEQEHIIKNGNHYFIKDKLFKYWVKFVYQKRFRDIDPDPDRQRKQFKEEFNNQIENFFVCMKKDLPARIIELLYCFGNDAFQLNGRKYKLPTFKKFEPFRINDTSGRAVDVIEAQTERSSWYICLKKDGFYENDINLILQRAKDSSKKLERCLIISLSDIEENARLKALQERFWIWNQNELNVLLALFDKPYIA